jgi:hypothetical protein
MSLTEASFAVPQIISPKSKARDKGSMEMRCLEHLFISNLLVDKKEFAISQSSHVP